MQLLWMEVRVDSGLAIYKIMNCASSDISAFPLKLWLYE